MTFPDEKASLYNQYIDYFYKNHKKIKIRLVLCELYLYNQELNIVLNFYSVQLLNSKKLSTKFNLNFHPIHFLSFIFAEEMFYKLHSKNLS